MAAVLALLSTLVAAKLQLIQQWWLPTFDILDGCTCNGNNPTLSTRRESKREEGIEEFMNVWTEGLVIMLGD
jgi:hypothetical protein